jgi:Tol biopolymer transport system component
MTRAGGPAPQVSRRLAELRGAIPFSLAPLLSLAGLAIVAGITLSLLTGSLPTLAGPGGNGGNGGNGGGGGGGGPIRTPTPSNVVVIDPRTNVPGALLYVKSGNIWIQSGAQAHQVTSDGADSMPTFSPDGQWIYFIHSNPGTGKWPSEGVVRVYDLEIQSLERIPADGSGQPEVIMNGQVHQGSYHWSAFIRQPSISPDGKTAAVISDGPDPSQSDPVLQFVNLTTGKMTNPKLPEAAYLGHQDPAWSPDGGSVLYVHSERNGALGAPTIVRYDLTTKRTKTLTNPGYIAPAWSPDGRYIAATKTSSFGTDIVILDASTGAELLRLTKDESSFDPVWSPAGDAIAYFHLDHGVVDLYEVPLQGTAPSWTVGDPLALTESAGLEAVSRPSWFIPPDQLPPTPPPTPVVTPAVSSAAPSAP